MIRKKKIRFIPFVLSDLAPFYRKTVSGAAIQSWKLFQQAENKKTADTEAAGELQELAFSSFSDGGGLQSISLGGEVWGGGSLNPPKAQHRW